MLPIVEKVISTTNSLSHLNQGIHICTTANSHEGIDLARKILEATISSQTLLLLSGGRTPKELYTNLSMEGINPGAVGMIDERYGKKLHKDSNEVMLFDSGILTYLSKKNIAFYPVLQDDIGREECAENYDQELRSMFSVYQNSIAILGIGVDGHTAGIPANPSIFKDGFADKSMHKVVSSYDDHGGFYKERVTMTFLGLSMMDFLLVLVFGDDKREALEKVFTTGSLEEIPGRIYTNPAIAERTLFITDQNV